MNAEGKTLTVASKKLNVQNEDSTNLNVEMAQVKDS